MKNKLLILTIIILFCLNVDHILWIMEYNTPGSGWTEELFPLLINNIIFLPIIPLLLLWKSKKEISTQLTYLMIITVIVQNATTIYARLTDDPLAAGLPFVIVAIPLSVLLLIFSVKELRSS